MARNDRYAQHQEILESGRVDAASQAHAALLAHLDREHLMENQSGSAAGRLFGSHARAWLEPARLGRPFREA